MLTFITNFLNTIKNWIIGIAALVAAVFAGLFLYYKNKAQIDEAELKQEKVNEDLRKDDEQIAQNNQALQAEAAKRAALEKEKTNEPTNQDVIDRFNNNK